jgi:hypothetical protein
MQFKVRALVPHLRVNQFIHKQLAFLSHGIRAVAGQLDHRKETPCTFVETHRHLPHSAGSNSVTLKAVFPHFCGVFNSRRVASQLLPTPPDLYG